MSFMHFDTTTATSISTMLSAGSGAYVQQIDGLAPYNTSLAIRFNTDGTVQVGKFKDGGAMVWSSAGSWITPNGDADSSYDVRFTSSAQILGTGKFTTLAAVEDTWIDLGAVRSWISNKTTSGPRIFSCTFQVRKNAGPPPTTGSAGYTFDIDNVI